MENSIICPVSHERINESVVRTVASFIFLIGILVLVTELKWLAIFLVIDFAARAFSDGSFSLLKFLSLRLALTFKFPVKPIDAAPKKFAALVGFIFALVITIALFFNWNVTALVFGTVLIICAGLEAFAGYCVGCQFYTWFVLPLKKIVSKI